MTKDLKFNGRTRPTGIYGIERLLYFTTIAEPLKESYFPLDNSNVVPFKILQTGSTFHSALLFSVTANDNPWKPLATSLALVSFAM